MKTIQEEVTCCSDYDMTIIIFIRDVTSIGNVKKTTDHYLDYIANNNNSKFSDY